VPRPATVPLGESWCTACGQIKPLELFNQSSTSLCAEWFRVYRQAHYRLNREAYIQRNNRVLAHRRGRWVQLLWEYLERHPCVDCGVKDARVLEFDHRDPLTKLESVSLVARQGIAWQRIEAEIAKCDVRCANCHRRRTALQFDWPKGRFSAEVDLAGLEPATSRMRSARSPS
jgi:hypothetical protein